MIFKLVTGIISILLGLLALFFGSGIDDLSKQILSGAGYSSKFILAGILFIVAGLIGIIFRKKKLFGFIYFGLLIIGSLFGLYIMISLQIAASMTGMPMGDMLGSSDVGTSIGFEGFVALVEFLFGIIALIKTQKMPNDAV
jgi:hypothetical protein